MTFEFTGTLMEGPEIDLIELSGLKITEEQEQQIWDQINSRDLLMSCPCVDEIEEESIDDAPGLSDTYFSYTAESKEQLGQELKEAILGILPKDAKELTESPLMQ